MIKLNFGCGVFKIPGFININQFEEVEPDLVANVLALPFDYATVDEIYMGHLLEHFN